MLISTKFSFHMGMKWKAFSKLEFTVFPRLCIVWNHLFRSLFFPFNSKCIKFRHEIACIPRHTSSLFSNIHFSTFNQSPLNRQIFRAFTQLISTLKNWFRWNLWLLSRLAWYLNMDRSLSRFTFNIAQEMKEATCERNGRAREISLFVEWASGRRRKSEKLLKVFFFLAKWNKKREELLAAESEAQIRSFQL